MTYTITVTDVDEATLRAAYEEHKDKIPPGATVCFVCEDLDLLSKYEAEPSKEDLAALLDYGLNTLYPAWVEKQTKH